MGQLPEYFEELRGTSRDTGLYPFSYEVIDGVFKVGRATVPLSSFNPSWFKSDEVGEEVGVDVAQIGSHPLYLPEFTGSLIASPRFFEWSNANPTEVAEVWRIIQDTYRHLSDISTEPQVEPARLGSFGFASGLKGNGAVHLQTLGSCSCMEVAIDGNFFDDQFDQGYCEYDMHNIWSKAQGVSLFAGMGHLARLAASSEG